MAMCLICTKLSCFKFTDYKQLNPNVYSFLYYISANKAELMTVLKVAITNSVYCSKIP